MRIARWPGTENARSPDLRFYLRGRKRHRANREETPIFASQKSGCAPGPPSRPRAKARPSTPARAANPRECTEARVLIPRTPAGCLCPRPAASRTKPAAIAANAPGRRLITAGRRGEAPTRLQSDLWRFRKANVHEREPWAAGSRGTPALRPLAAAFLQAATSLRSRRRRRSGALVARPLPAASAPAASPQPATCRPRRHPATLAASPKPARSRRPGAARPCKPSLRSPPVRSRLTFLYLACMGKEACRCHALSDAGFSACGAGLGSAARRRLQAGANGCGRHRGTAAGPAARPLSRRVVEAFSKFVHDLRLCRFDKRSCVVRVRNF